MKTYAVTIRRPNPYNYEITSPTGRTVSVQVARLGRKWEAHLKSKLDGNTAHLTYWEMSVLRDNGTLLDR